MRAAIGYVCVAALLGTAGASFWVIGYLQQRTVTRQERLFTLEYTGPEPGPLERSVEFVPRLPGIARMRGELTEHDATVQYWLRKYEALAVPADATEAAELDPGVLMLAAHAAYRGTAIDGSDPDAVRRLNGILALYVEVLKRDPARIDAAFNYEFIARRRNVLASLRGAPASFQRAAAPPPPGRTLHGDRGAVPLGLEKSEFKVIVPRPSDERQEQQEAGSGTPKARKG